jgi:predicted nucleotidyltransferase
VKQSSLELLVERIRRALEPRAEILDAYLFGSRARQHDGPLADVDVAVYVDPAASDVSPFGYAADLTTALLRELPGSTIDVVILNQAPPLLYHRVLRDGTRLLARRLQDTTTREGLALSRYCDFLPQLRKISEAQDRRISRGEFGR